MKMHLLSGGRLRMRRSVYDPSAAREEMMELPVSCALLRHPQGNALFDSGCHPEVARDPEIRWGGLARAMVPMFEPGDTVLPQLRQLGLAAEDIDLIVCSHLHPDHCGANALFPRASVFCHVEEERAARAEGAEKIGYLVEEWGRPEGFSTFDGQHDLFGDGRVVLLPMIGHTPGTTAALVALDRDGQFLLASDAAPVAISLAEGHAPRNSWNAERAVAALSEIRRIQTAGATVILGHDDAQWRSLRKGAACYA